MGLTSLLRMEGEGRAFLLISEGTAYREAADALFSILRSRSRVMLLESAVISHANWQAVSEEVAQFISAQRLKQVSLAAFGGATAIAQNLCLRHPRLVRSLVLFDVCTRPGADLITRWIDWLEEKLPMGLPFRSRINGFDGRPFLQRLRCPVLVVSSVLAGESEREQARLIAEGMPTAWYFQLDTGPQETENLRRCLFDFEQIPARCPQKGQPAAR